MVYLFSLRFEDDAGFDTRSPKETQGERALFPTEDRRRDHFPVLCCMRAERHLASIPQGSGAEHVAISVPIELDCGSIGLTSSAPLRHRHRRLRTNGQSLAYVYSRETRDAAC
jgi:hypothetical protein